jgi:rare lipoprotein A
MKLDPARQNHADHRKGHMFRCGGILTTVVLAGLAAGCVEKPKPVAQIAAPVQTARTEKPDAAVASILVDKPAVKSAARKVAGKVDSPEGYKASGTASWYGPRFHGRSTSNGEVFDSTSISAAHRSLPLPSYARVTNEANGRSIIVRVNDRGPFHQNRLVDVSQRTAELLDFRRKGMARVKVEYVGPAPVQADDRETLMASYSEPGKLNQIANRATTLLASLMPGGEEPDTEREEIVETAPAGPAVATATNPAGPVAPSPAARTAVASVRPAAAAPRTETAAAKQSQLATVPQATPVELADASPPSPVSATTPDDQIAGRISAGFAGMSSPQPLTASTAPMSEPVLGSMAFSPMGLRGAR